MSERVVVGDRGYRLAEVRTLLPGLTVEAVEDPAVWAGDDVVGLLVGTEVRVGPAELDRLPSLRVVATCSVGFDHIDLEEASRRGVWVCNVPDYCVEEVADHTLALLLALLRGVVELDRDVRAGGWNSDAAGPLRRLSGTRLGVVGFGRTGRAVAARALALGFEVWASDPVVPAERIAAAGARPATLAELLAACAAVTLHVPLTPETEGLIGTEEIARMPRGAVLVDTAREQLVDTAAVLRALTTGQLGGAALDVLAVEPPTRAAPAPQAPRLVVTPHAAWYSPEAEAEVYRRPVLAVRDALAGRRPTDAVTGPGL
ncbi:MAG TPA: NAD(P)-dependent oxidoreductase [Gaiellaceae bacterium]|nr:NAD(P)-dependent oxidoreductase [Gaiellaceae bacterium]